MRWRRRPAVDRDSLETRFRALARLVERQGFRASGLVAIEVDGAYVVRGMRQHGDSPSLSMSSVTIAAKDLRAEIETLSP